MVTNCLLLRALENGELQVPVRLIVMLAQTMYEMCDCFATAYLIRIGNSFNIALFVIVFNSSYANSG
jgi:hypothetical protein